MAGTSRLTRNKGKEPARQQPGGNATSSRSTTTGGEPSMDTVRNTQFAQEEELGNNHEDSGADGDDAEDEPDLSDQGTPFDPDNNQPPLSNTFPSSQGGNPAISSRTPRPVGAPPLGQDFTILGGRRNRPGGRVTLNLQDESDPDYLASTVRSGANAQPLGGQTAFRPLAGGYPTQGLTSDAFIQERMEALWKAEDEGAPPEQLARLQARLTMATQHLWPAIGHPSVPRVAHDDAGKLMGTLNKVQPKPRLGSETRSPTPQNVAQWVCDIEAALQSVQVLVDSPTRTYWILGTVQYTVHRELLQQQVNAGSIKTWEQLKAEQTLLVQDPILTKYQNFSRLFNLQWRNNDSVNSFLLQLSKKESILQHNFFEEHPTEELKVAYVWSKIPDEYAREMKRNSVLQTIVDWASFERALRNAETAVGSDGATATRKAADDAGQGVFKGKRRASPQAASAAYGKKRDRKEYQPARSQSRDSSLAQTQRTPAKEEGTNDSRSTNVTSKAHWKNRNSDAERDQNRRNSEEGKDKP